MWAKATGSTASYFLTSVGISTPKANIGKMVPGELGPIRQDPGRWDPSVSPPPSAHAQGRLGKITGMGEF